MDAHRVEQLYCQHHQQLYVIALSVTGNRAAAEDAVHAGVQRVLQSRRPVRAGLAYLARAVRNAAVDFQRLDRRNTTLLDAAIPSVEPPRIIAGDRALDEAFALLNAKERETILLKTHAGMTYAEIGTLCSASSHTVASWYRRGIEKLRRHFEVEVNEPD